MSEVGCCFWGIHAADRTSGNGQIAAHSAFAHICGLLGDDEFSGAEDRAYDGTLREFQQEPRYFEYLLTPFTEPGELFGFFDIGKLFDAHGRSVGLERLHEGMMQHAEIIFLDEVFNASSAILNSLLTLHQRTQIP